MEATLADTGNGMAALAAVSRDTSVSNDWIMQSAVQTTFQTIVYFDYKGDHFMHSSMPVTENPRPYNLEFFVVIFLKNDQTVHWFIFTKDFYFILAFCLQSLTKSSSVNQSVQSKMLGGL